MRIIFIKVREVSQKYPIVRGMASYTVIWPTGSLIQQKLAGYDELNYLQALRFSLYGGFFVAPTLYCWLRCSSYFWPKSDLKSAITKALVEQVTYTPTAMCCFFFGINLLEMKPITECIEEVKHKFWPTYKIGVCVWPILQTVNFFFIPEHNRVVYVSCCSLIWTSFLAYMKALNAKTSQNDIKDDNNFKHKGHIKIQSTNQVEDKNKRVSIIR
ncbi:mpv17-like protein [Apis laboriosa]|uniref:Mpv17-like protein n=2 Tax=Apis TaxID=7459 RepID=A0A7M7L1V5_APIME|nr:mpv17-like protein [Apis florea]XP_026295441.1 mpv17-like protein [Apis mellifera]XP_028522709.1 mpv17-like protein [Apis cerana]XP_031368968.1 mpv17-like protein [Apis dorsata]XP_043787705.1 mpv17-like protein [Apis laboriosa]|eukprot:XP_026295441.1 mpv17-like protein [Apis mellifera]